MVNASVVGMSARSTRRGTINSLTNQSRRSSKKTSEAFMYAYDIYCVNFYDTGLNAVRDAFIQQIKDGLRRSIFIIDLDKELEEAYLANSLIERSSVRKLSNFLPVDPTALTMMRINECLEEYESVSRKIDSEQNFDLMRYWQRFMPAELKYNVNKPSPKRPSSERTVKNQKSNTDSNLNVKIKCFGVTSKDHHKVGKGKPLSKRLYIKDQPMSVRIIILVVGTLTVDYYKSLLQLMQPLRGIIHFLPEKCAYDLLVPRPRRDQQLKESIEKIHRDIHSLRKRISTKPVGIFQQRIPQMSVCQATRHVSDIFNQLSWFIYDVHQLREQYEDYYLKPYQEINVQMPPEDKMQTTYDTARSLSIRGHYMNTDMPMVVDDIGTISLYMESLLNTFGDPQDLLSELEVLLLANPSPCMQTRLLDKLLVYANAFKSIVKLPKSNHLIVDHANSLLRNLVSFVDPTYLRNIYHACLEYNILRHYFSSGYIVNTLRYTPYTEDKDLRFLPKFAKLYLTDDSVSQRIIELIEEYETYEIEEIHPYVKLYTFEKALNEVVEHQKQINLPTKLCFRDFTLYEMHDFIKDLVTPEMLEKQRVSDERNTEVSKESSYMQVHNENDEPYTCNQPSRRYVVTPSIFILPKSLKAARLVEQSKNKEKLERQSARQSKDASRSTANQGENESMNESIKEEDPQRPRSGLPAGHRMLKGYNLDDTRQTIKVQTSKYHFDEGNITLYQEKWNFRQTNKCMSIDIDKQIIHLTNKIGNMTATSPDVRIQTPRGISLRIKPEAKECAKAVLSYPNGLTLYCLDTHAEHLWSDYENELNERRRICTPYGAVIVFYRENDMVLIMRYNGEVYRLYGYVDIIVEPEVGEEDESSDFINACSTLSTYSSYKPLEMVKKKRSKRASGGAQRKGRTSSNSSESQAARDALYQARQMKMLQDAALFASIDSELKFLEMLMDIFEFDYKQLKLTTALGSVVIVVKETQRIYCDKPVRVTEWHDYYANESYAMREDGVRMLWTHDSLKCYHADGTVITTGTIDGIDRGILDDEIDKEISTSSSHQHEEEEEKPSSLSSSDGSAPIVVNISDTGLVYSLEKEVAHSEEKPVVKESIRNFVEEGEVEAELIYDYTFATYTPNSYTIMHKNYAGLNFLFTHINKMDLHLETKVFAADNINFWIRAMPIELDLPRTSDFPDAEESDEKIEFGPEPVSSEADPDEWTLPKRLPSYTKNLPEPSAVDIEGPQFSLELHGNAVTLHANLRKFGCDETAFPIRGNIKLVSKLDQDLSTVFRNWVETFHRFINCSCPKKRITYFVESQGDGCIRKGIELFKAIPAFGEYGFHAGNIHIDPVEMKKMQDQMANNFEWYGKDMAKFPRFQEKRRDKNSIEIHGTDTLPGLLSAKVFLQIPTQLAYTDRIHLFLDPFTGMKFRKLKHRFREALLYQLHPMLKRDVAKQFSKLSWKNRHAANKRRMFMEQQRLSLYAAMLKHKVYPNYFQFRDHYFGHVRNIDFFEFMSAKCNEGDNPTDQYAHHQNVHQETANRTVLSSKEINKLRKKCLCPKYINSL